jgi:hypothetical protein
MAGPAERRLVAACLLWYRPEALAPLLPGVGWVGALLLARTLGVTEAVAHALLATTAEALPAPVRAQLSDLSAAAGARNALVLSELARAQAVLAAAGLPSAALKGTALLAAHLPSIAARGLADIDLLVRPRDLARAAAALAAAGLAPPAGALPALDGGEDPLARNPGTDHVRALASWDGILLELHDRLPGGGADPDVVVAAARRVTWQRRTLDLAAPDDLAGMLCRHVLLKHGEAPRLRARHVADLAALARSAPPDWDAVRARYGSGGGRFAIRRSLALVEAARREAEGQGTPGSDGLFSARSPGVRERVMALSYSTTEALRARDAVRAVFPSRAYMEARFGFRPGSPWTPLLYPWRLLSGAARRLVRR